MENIDYTINDTIVRIAPTKSNEIKEGDIFTAKALKLCSCGCKTIVVDIGIKHSETYVRCAVSKNRYLASKDSNILWCNATKFKKLDNLVSTQMQEIEEILKTPIFENL